MIRHRKRSAIIASIRKVDACRVRQDLFHLCKDPLPFRKTNFTLLGHPQCTLYEADDFISNQLERLGWIVSREEARVQACRCDKSKPVSHQYAPPRPEDPWYTAYNVYGEKPGLDSNEDILLLLAHKDSQSWVDSPGAYDNAVGVAALLELARLLSDYPNRKTLRFLFCNEEHTPWTSVVAAQAAHQRRDRFATILNVDSLGGKSLDAIGRGLKTNAICYTHEAGQPFAEHLVELNELYGIGLKQTIHRHEKPRNDDGSFVKEGFEHAIACHGSIPYADPNYHMETDIPEHVDEINVRMAIQLILAFVLSLDSLNSSCQPPIL